MSMTLAGESAIAIGGTARVATDRKQKSAYNADLMVAVNIGFIPL
jgi:hypothetical protein